MRWCYVGKPAEAPLEAMAGESEADEAGEFFAKLRGRREYTDEELVEIVLREAERDCFCGTGRIFLDEFSKDYGCPPERVLSALRSTGLKWRFGPTQNIILITF